MTVYQNPFANQITYADYKQLQDEFEMKKQAQAQQAQLQAAQINKLNRAAATGEDLPSAVQEYNFFNKLDPAGQERFLQVKRSNPYLNLGGSMVQPTMDGGIKNQFIKTPSPEDMPAFKAEQEAAKKEAENNSIAQEKVFKMKSLDEGFNQLRASAKASPSGGAAAGWAALKNVAGYGGADSIALKDFTTKTGALESQIREAFRVAGSGADTERDAAPLIAMLPAWTDSEAVKEAAINSTMETLKNRIAEMTKQRGLPNPYNAPQSDGLPEGATVIGTSGGKRVLQLPDGSHVMEQ